MIIRKIRGLDSGSTIWKKNRKSFDPSSWAASRNSLGTLFSKNERAMMRFHTPTAPGRTTDQMVSNMPRSRTTRYFAMRPPSMNIVITKSSMKNLRA